MSVRGKTRATLGLNTDESIVEGSIGGATHVPTANYEGALRPPNYPQISHMLAQNPEARPTHWDVIGEAGRRILERNTKVAEQLDASNQVNLFWDNVLARKKEVPVSAQGYTEQMSNIFQDEKEKLNIADPTVFSAVMGSINGAYHSWTNAAFETEHHEFLAQTKNTVDTNVQTILQNIQDDPENYETYKQQLEFNLAPLKDAYETSKATQLINQHKESADFYYAQGMIEKHPELNGSFLKDKNNTKYLSADNYGKLKHRATAAYKTFQHNQIVTQKLAELGVHAKNVEKAGYLAAGIETGETTEEDLIGAHQEGILTDASFKKEMGRLEKFKTNMGQEFNLLEKANKQLAENDFIDLGTRYEQEQVFSNMVSHIERESLTAMSVSEKLHLASKFSHPIKKMNQELSAGINSTNVDDLEDVGSAIWQARNQYPHVLSELKKKELNYIDYYRLQTKMGIKPAVAMVEGHKIFLADKNVTDIEQAKKDWNERIERGSFTLSQEGLGGRLNAMGMFQGKQDSPHQKRLMTDQYRKYVQYYFKNYNRDLANALNYADVEMTNDWNETDINGAPEYMHKDPFKLFHMAPTKDSVRNLLRVSVQDTLKGATYAGAPVNIQPSEKGICQIKVDNETADVKLEEIPIKGSRTQGAYYLYFIRNGYRQYILGDNGLSRKVYAIDAKGVKASDFAGD